MGGLLDWSSFLQAKENNSREFGNLNNISSKDCACGGRGQFNCQVLLVVLHEHQSVTVNVGFSELLCLPQVVGHKYVVFHADYLVLQLLHGCGDGGGDLEETGD